MIARLSDLLRLTLDDVDTQEVPLWRELEFLRLYLSIEQVRFEDRLRVRITADPICRTHSFLTWRFSLSSRMPSGTDSARANRRCASTSRPAGSRRCWC